ncbi:hypothetical protein BJ166DRAFT_520378 [Pestalotiopsis sp. NC0098]|nr:hypothetical protein BJ166DRAFT_520378 [Pestalotiopsis sp. NC0098]
MLETIDSCFWAPSGLDVKGEVLGACVGGRSVEGRVTRRRLLNDTRVACVGSRSIAGQNVKLDGLVLHLAELEGDAAIVTSSVDGEEIRAARETGATQAAASCGGSGADLQVEAHSLDARVRSDACGEARNLPGVLSLGNGHSQTQSGQRSQDQVERLHLVELGCEIALESGSSICWQKLDTIRGNEGAFIVEFKRECDQWSPNVAMKTRRSISCTSRRLELVHVHVPRSASKAGRAHNRPPGHPAAQRHPAVCSFERVRHEKLTVILEREHSRSRGSLGPRPIRCTSWPCNSGTTREHHS